MKVSHREQVILMALIFIIIVGIGGMTLIKSEFTAWQSTKANLDTKQAELQAVEDKIATDKDLEQAIKDKYALAKDAGKYFFPEMMTYEIDQYLTPFFSDNKVGTTSLTIEEQTAEDAIYYAYELFHVDYDLGAAADLNESRLHATKGLQNYVTVTTSKPEKLVLTKVTYETAEDTTWQDMMPVFDALKAEEKSMYIYEIGDTSFTIYLFSLAEIQEPELTPKK